MIFAPAPTVTARHIETARDLGLLITMASGQGDADCGSDIHMTHESDMSAERQVIAGPAFLADWAGERDEAAASQASRNAAYLVARIVMAAEGWDDLAVKVHAALIERAGQALSPSKIAKMVGSDTLTMHTVLRLMVMQSWVSATGNGARTNYLVAA